jgi:IS1 family transposase
VLPPAPVEVEVCRSAARERRRGRTAELAAMGRDGQSQAPPRGRWPALAPHPGPVLAYGFGRRKADVFLQLQQLVAPLGLTQVDTDGWGADERHLAAAQQQVGQAHPQNIASTPIKLRTRLKR